MPGYNDSVRSIVLLCLVLSVSYGCSPTAGAKVTAFYVFRSSPAALVQLSNGGSVLRELPVTIPDGCSLDNIFSPPVGETLAIEFSCSFGQSVVWFNTVNGKMTQPVTNSDSHFLAWTPDGQSAYLKVDSLGLPQIVVAPVGGKPGIVPITGLTYDVAPIPGGSDHFLFSFSRGMGLGSEMWKARAWGAFSDHILTEPHSYIAFSRWSPDGMKIAFIKIPDSATPFTVGELWVMGADGSNARRLADADAGHGFAEAWSPDGSRIAFVVRENPGDAQADQDANALRSNIAIVRLGDGTESRVTHFQNAQVEAPAWSPDGNRLAFTVVLNDKMSVYVADLRSGTVQPALSVPACCAVWMQK